MKIQRSEVSTIITNKQAEMSYNLVKLSALLLLFFGITGLHAQEAIPAAGGNASGSGGSASFTVGQVAYTTSTSSNGSVAQGVQQPYEISVVTDLEEALGIIPGLTVYPNPITDFLTLKVDASTSLSVRSMRYQLYDISGKLIENKELTSNETSIDMKNLVPAVYFLKITSNNKAIITFKIIKN
jgi:hypothetical protein